VPTAEQQRGCGDQNDLVHLTLDRKLDELQRQEESVVGRLVEENRTGISRRRDADPRIVLGVVVVAAVEWAKL
jgi:hypothetical protein